tara:strand:- start:11893 stop:13050 length:1158 start_codon:yes stop_codon:yes gene_type:complete
MKVGIDATNIGSGGGVTHLKEILNNFNHEMFKNDIEKIIVFSSKKVLDQLNDFHFLQKKTYDDLNKGLLSRVYFQLFKFDKEIDKYCDILYSLTGDYIGKFVPVVSMSRNMLLHERDVWKDIKSPKEILGHWLRYKRQEKCFKKSKAIIFISKYAKEYISKSLPLDQINKSTIYHGISSRFFSSINKQKHIREYSFNNPFKFLYVSTIHVYKNHINLIKAITKLRENGHPIILNLVGGVIFKPEAEKLFKLMNKVDPNKEFIFYHGSLDYEKIDHFYKSSNGIIYASTCENMPNILIESMASGMPIACSDKEPMPEFLKQGGFYFNAKSVSSITEVLKVYLESPEDRNSKAKISIDLAKEFSWKKTSNQTFKYINQIYNNKIEDK